MPDNRAAKPEIGIKLLRTFMAMRVEKAFGLSMDLLLRMQAWYDATQMRARADEIDVRCYQPA